MMSIQESKKFVRLRNPYTFGVPVRGPNNFFGREEELRLIFDTLENVPPGHKQDLVILGPRRIGKSSLLYRLLDLLHEHPGFVPVYVDVQNVKPRAIRPLFFKILRDIQKGYEHKKLLDQLPIFAVLTQSHIPPDLEFLTFTDDITSLNQTIASQNLPRLVLMFDEAEILLEIGGRDMLDWLRSLIQSLGFCIFVIAGSDQIYSMTQDYGSPFYNVFKAIELLPLSNQAAQQLLTKPMLQVGVNISPREVEVILEATGNVAYFIQGIAHYLIEELNKELDYFGDFLRDENDLIKVGENTLDEVIDKSREYLSPQFNYLWNISSRTQQIVLYVLAKHGKPQTMEKLVSGLPGLRNRLRLMIGSLLPLSKQEQDAFRDLVQKQILRTTLGESKYWFVVPLFQNWITSHINDAEIIRLAGISDTPKQSDPEILSKLVSLIIQTFNLEELRTLAFDLMIDYENLAGLSKADKTREIVAYFARRGELLQLLKYLKRQRPHAEWPELMK